MRKVSGLLLIMSMFLILLTVSNCKKTERNTKTEAKENSKEVAKNTETVLKFELPKISPTTNVKDIEPAYKAQINKVEAALPGLKKKEIKTTLNNVPNTPLRIWYDHNGPVKIEYGVADDSGTIDGVFQYYLNDGKLWYADQIFAKYIFQDNKLKYWLDENWNVNEIPQNDFNKAEEMMLKDVESLIDQMK